jgi:hypothetical protein
MEGWEALADGHGILGAGHASAAGLTPRDRRTLVRRGQLVHLDRGWYALAAALPDPSDRWQWRRRMHALRALAAIQAYAHEVAASHHTALVLHGLPTYAADLRQVHLTRLGPGQFRRRRSLTVHERLPDSRTTATIRDSVVDIATAVIDTVRLNGLMAGLVAADAALHIGALTLEDLGSGAAVLTGPLSRLPRRLAVLADGRAESPGETPLREALRLMGLVTVPQYRIVDGSFVAIVDLYVEEHLLAVEFDGFVKYGRLNPHAPGPTPAEVLFAEKIREDHVRELGHGFLRVAWSDLEDLHALRRRIELLIERLGRRPAA